MQVTTKVTHYVDYYDLEKAVTEFYKLPKRFDILESPNDTDYAIEVKAEPLDEFEVEDLAEMKESSSIACYQMYLPLQDMCLAGAIPAGSYVVRVSW